MNATQTKTESDAGEKAGWLEIVRRQVGSLRFGVVQIVVHDSQVTQIDKTGGKKPETKAPTWKTGGRMKNKQ
jgi:hypothetical protein